MGFFNSSKRKEIKASLIVDISPHSIAIGIILRGEKAMPHLAYMHREYVTYGRKPSVKEISQKLSKLLVKIIETEIIGFVKNFSSKDSKLSIVDSYIMHSLAWSHSVVRKLIIDHDSEILITKENLDRIAEETAKKQSDTKGMLLLSRIISDIDLNGYDVKNPWNKKAKKLSLTATETYIDESMIKLVENAIEKRIKLKFIHTSEGYAAYEVMKYTHPEHKELVMIHVGGETTEMVMIENGVLKAASSVPYGVHTLCRIWGTGKEHDQEIAYSHIIAALSKTRAFTKSEKSNFDAEIKKWQLAIEESLHTMSKGLPLPSDLYLVSLPHYRLIAEAIIKDESFLVWSEKNHIVRSVYEEPHPSNLYTVEKGALYDPLLTIAITSFLY